MALPLGGAIGSPAPPPPGGGRGGRGPRAARPRGGGGAALLPLAGGALTAAVTSAVLMRDAPPPPANVPAPEVEQPTRDPRQWRLGAASGLLVVGQSAVLGFIVLFLHDARGVSLAAAA